MKKTILIIILSILSLSFLALILNAYNLQKEYFRNKTSLNVNQDENEHEEKIKPSVYQDYNKELLESAVKNNQVILLYFTSNWCNECSLQDSLNKEVFDELVSEGLVGLKIHILDSETTTETDALAKKYDAIKEQSFVLLDKKGAVYFKTVGVLEKEVLKQKLMELR